MIRKSGSSTGGQPPDPWGLMHWFPGGNGKRQYACTASRKPGTALVSLPSVALSSVSGKAVTVYLSGCQSAPLKFKVVLDKGYASIS